MISRRQFYYLIVIIVGLSGCFGSSNVYMLDKRNLDQQEVKRIYEEVHILNTLLEEHILHVYSNSIRVDVIDEWISFYALEIEPHLSDDAWSIYEFWLTTWTSLLIQNNDLNILIQNGKDPISFYYFIRMMSLLKEKNQFWSEIFSPTWENLAEEDIIFLLDEMNAKISHILEYAYSLNSVVDILEDSVSTR